jgi:uncharacterized protein YbaR (Trm112 family)
MKMIVCPTCKGTKEVTITVHEAGKVSKEVLPCCLCHGAGKVTEKFKQAMDAFWCNCGNPSEESTFHADAPGVKHHYTCNDCGKVTQVG